MNKKIAVIGMVLILVPTLVSLGALAQEEQKIEEIGQWKSARIIGLKFEGNQTFNTTADVFYFTISDGRNSLIKIFGDFLYKRAVFKVDAITENVTELAPDENGTYTLEMPLPGSYMIGIITAPTLEIPLIGKYITPTYQSSVEVIREQKSGFLSTESEGIPPFLLILSIALVVAITVSIVVYLYRRQKE